MAESKFTPGPWRVSAVRDKVFVGDGSVPLAIVNNVLVPPAMAAANGRLMAAAPDMYGALKHARDVMQRLNTINSLAISPLASINASYISEISTLLERIEGDDTND